MKKLNYLFIPILAICLLLCYSCSEEAIVTEICNNGIDDDGDGNIDCDDTKCDLASVCNPVEICDNGIDDDDDGDIDCADADCAAAAGCFEECNNGIDDDGNGAIDCFDSTCTGTSEAIFVGVFVGKLVIDGLIQFPDNDTLIIGNGVSNSDKDLTIFSSIINKNLTGSLSTCNKVILEHNILIEELTVGQDTFFNVSIGDDSYITITDSIDRVFMDLNGVSIDSGTMSGIIQYPINNISISSSPEGSIRQ